MSSCCANNPKKKAPVDKLLAFSLLLIIPAYGLMLIAPEILAIDSVLYHFTHTVYELLNRMWLSLVLSIVVVGLIAQVPREFIVALLGRAGFTGILRATLAGVLLDLCNHGILLVAMKLYERGVSLAQVMAFLIASPWNSLSLTLIMVALMGLGWTLAFIVLSVVVAVISGLIFHLLVKFKKLPENPYQIDLAEDFAFMAEAKKGLQGLKMDKIWLINTFKTGLKDSRMVLRWIFFGIVLAAMVRALLPMDTFQTWFGPTLAGLGLTLLVATVLEVCSEGATPIAADLLTRANAPGNSFTFLMAGVVTDYTEIMAVKETMRSWKIALFLPLISLPQVLVIAWLLNQLK